MKVKKERLDVLLVNKGYFDTRQRAKIAIMEGVVFVGGNRIDKAGTEVPEDAEIFVKENPCPYVSRGGFKLEKSIDVFNIDLKDKICADLGASTGGFTDCMLMNGAKKVYAIDVGYGQLAYKLRVDERVVNIEKMNIRYLDTELIKDEIDFISIDVSFISLNLILPVAESILSSEGSVVALVKPQFEAGREQVGKNGIVRDAKVHKEVIQKAATYAENVGLFVQNIDYSPIKGTKGNIEYLMHLGRKSKNVNLDVLIEKVVKESHEERM